MNMMEGLILTDALLNDPTSGNTPPDVAAALHCVDYPVSHRLNHVVNDDAACSTRVEIQTQDSLF